MLTVEHVATPLTAFTLVVPDNVPPPGFAPIATVIAPVNPVTTFPDVSRAATRTAGIVCPASVDCGCVVNTRFAAGGGGGGGGGDGGGGGGGGGGGVGAVILNYVLEAPVSPLELAVSV